MTTLTTELDAATTQLEAAAPALRPKGLGGLTYEVVEREVGQWDRFDNRRHPRPSLGFTMETSQVLRVCLIALRQQN